MTVVHEIKHYQHSIEKCSNDEKRLLHCIEKLYKLPVTVQHLQDTGVGRTVNALRKYEGTVGDAAKALVAKWKTMVVDEETSEGEDDDDQHQADVHDGSSNNSDVGADKERANESRQSGHKSSHKSHDSKSTSHSDHSTSKENSRGENEKKSKSSHDSKESQREKDRHKKSNDKHVHSAEKSKRSDANNRSDKSKNSSRKEGQPAEKHLKESNGINGHGSDRKRKSTENSEKRAEKRRRVSISDKSEEGEDNQILPSLSCTSSSASSSPRTKSESPPPKAKAEDKNSREFRQKKDKSEHKSSSEKYEKRSDKKLEKSKESSRSRHHSTSSRNKSEKGQSSKDKGSDSSKMRSKYHKRNSPVKRAMKEHLNGNDGIDCQSGASFAEALNMCSHPIPKKKTTSTASPGSPVTKSKSEPCTSRQTLKTDTLIKEDGLALLAPNVKLEPLTVDLAATLPEVSSKYKPLPVNHLNSLHRRLNEEKALSDVMYTKNVRTKVYSGAKTGCFTVPSLCDVAIRSLIENIEALEATGGVPYDILKPVLEKATADQLLVLEHYNPYLIEDTDPLWQFHCSRQFRSQQRKEMESWRDMYMRCVDEREAKLKILTASIKQSIDKSLPVRSTKLAYVDNIVKPPRGVLRKQAKYGTANSSCSSVSDVKKKIISGANAATNISVPPPPSSRIRSSSSGIVKKNKAPLMAKALQLIKGRYRR